MASRSSVTPRPARACRSLSCCARRTSRTRITTPQPVERRRSGAPRERGVARRALVDGVLLFRPVLIGPTDDREAAGTAGKRPGAVDFLDDVSVASDRHGVVVTLALVYLRGVAPAGIGRVGAAIDDRCGAATAVRRADSHRCQLLDDVGRDLVRVGV